MEEKAKVVYRIPYSCGKSYIGETRRRLETRLREHQEACQKGTLEKSALSEHAWKNHYAMKWDETTVIDTARHPRELLLKEAIHIQMTPAEECLNRDTGLELPGCWVAALRRQRTRPTEQVRHPLTDCSQMMIAQEWDIPAVHYLRPEEDRSNTIETLVRFLYPHWYWKNSISYTSQPAEKPPSLFLMAMFPRPSLLSKPPAFVRDDLASQTSTAHTLLY